MLLLENLNYKEKVYLVELVRRICPDLSVCPDTLNSLKPGVIQFCFNNWHARPLKKKVIERIINKILNPQIIDGEITISEERRIE